MSTGHFPHSDPMKLPDPEAVRRLRGATRRVTRAERIDALAQIVGGDATGSTPTAAAQRFARSASGYGIDLDLLWVIPTNHKGAQKIRMACLAVLGAGRTAMLFPSRLQSWERATAEPEARSHAWAQRAALLADVCEHLQVSEGHRVQIAQVLAEPSEFWTIAPAMAAGFVEVGKLVYLSRSLASVPTLDSRPWPEDVALKPVGSMRRGTATRAAMLEALEASYADTRDCPKLCGMRDTEDVLDSHLGVGDGDTEMWTRVEQSGKPRGCALFSHCPDQGTVELVYVGIAPELRGKGLGARLITRGIIRASETGASDVVCAVDRDNDPARRMYTALGFTETSSRVALVKPVQESLRVSD